MSKLDERKRMTLEEGRKIHEDWLAYIEGGAEVDTESLGDANWHRFAIKDYDAWIAERGTLRKRVEELERLNKEWLKENAPGGWIDNLRKQLQSYRELAEMVEKIVMKSVQIDDHPELARQIWACRDKARELREMDKGAR